MAMYIVTDRLTLRPTAIKDAAELFVIRSHEEVHKHMYVNTSSSLWGE
jgi:RimJ/RimL family protein N-acetyltransferase